MSSLCNGRYSNALQNNPSYKTLIFKESKMKGRNTQCINKYEKKKKRERKSGEGDSRISCLSIWHLLGFCWRQWRCWWQKSFQLSDVTRTWFEKISLFPVVAYFWYKTVACWNRAAWWRESLRGSYICINTYRERAIKMEPDSFQHCPVPGQEVKDKIWNTKGIV